MIDIQDVINQVQKALYPLDCPIGFLEYDRQIVLAARAKAAMAKHGYVICDGRPTASIIYAIRPNPIFNEAGLARIEYDSTDAVSEARAILRCVHKVLLPNPQDHRAGEAGSGA